MWQPPSVDQEVARWTLDQPPQLQTLRAGLQQAVTTQLGPATAGVSDLVDRLVIVATELASNALRHGRPPTIVALLYADGGHLIVDVVDHDPSTRPVVEQRPPGAGGLGLTVTQRLAEQVGWFPTRSAKHVWAQFTLPVG